MAVETMDRETSTVPSEKVVQQPSKSKENLDNTWKEIVAQARCARAPVRGAFFLSSLTGLLMWASFTPLDWGPLGWICLVPMIALVRLPTRTRLMYTACYLSGLIYSLATLQWMRLGDPTMYIAWAALSLYVAVYFPVFVGLSRIAVHRFSLPLIVAVPATWVGLEYARAHLLTGFSWYYLAHTQHNWVELIQISDLLGAYGISFVIALTSACLAGLLPMSFFAKLKLIPEAALATETQPVLPMRRTALQVAICLTLFATVLGYGYVRRSQAEFESGPRVALIQGNFTASLKHDPNETGQIYQTHDQLTGLAVKQQPDLIIWPETMFRWPLLESSPNTSDEELRRLAPYIPVEQWKDPTIRQVLAANAQKAGAAMIVGIDAFEPANGRLQHYNSAAFVRPDTGLQGRYDKMHRVIFGEYIPLKDELPWLHKLTPFPHDFGIAAGEGATVFEYKGWRFAPIICFEDTVPHLVRGIVKATASIDSESKPVDCLVNLTNDGWFHGSSELDQHLITAKFRAVECRMPLVRAVNTGISAIIDGDGVVVEPDVFIDGEQKGRTSMRDPKTGKWHKQLNAAIVDTIPLDNRNSFYVANGDWFAGSCGFFTVLVFIGNFLPLRRKKSIADHVPRTVDAS